MTDTPPRRRSLPPVLYLFLTFLVGAFVERQGWLPADPRRPPAGVGRTFEPFWEAWHLVERRFVDRSKVEPKRMTQGAIAGMLNALGDQGHTTYLTAEELQHLEQSLQGNLEGIGARLSMQGRQPTILHTMPHSPARAAGLRPGDVLLAVDDHDVAGQSLERVVQQVRGPAGTTVRLRVHRPEAAEPLEVTVERARVEIPDVSWQLLPGTPVAHVALHTFGERSAAQLRQALEEARGRGARGVLLDLRGNQGGLREQAVVISSEFLPEGRVVFLEQDASGERKEVPARAGGTALDVPLVALVDEGTASSAEILAGALQDHGRATLVGATTFGTGTVLEPFKLSDGSSVLLAVLEWLTPKGRQIWHKGITPDVPVVLPDKAAALLPEDEGRLTAEQLRRSEDKQLLQALEVLQKELGKEPKP